MNAVPAPRAPEPQSFTPAIGLLRWQQEREVAAVLASAFLDDPLVAAICSVPVAERQRRIWWSFRVAVRSHCLSGQPAWTMLDSQSRPVGVVLATRPRPAPGAHPSDGWFAVRGFVHLGLGAVLRGLRAAQLIARQVPTEPFVYLRTLGVHPNFQHMRVGSRLVQQVLRAAAGWPVYLETAKEENLAFYARHGFTRVGEFRCLGVRVWSLRYPPNVKGGAR